MLCQQNLISQHKYMVTTQQKICYISKTLTSQRNELIQQKIRCVCKTCILPNCHATGDMNHTSVPYGYLLVALKPDQDERHRHTLRTNAFPARCSTCMFSSKVIDMLGIQWMAIYVNNNVGLHCGEWHRCRPIGAFECYLWQMVL